jgi:hypothetical protein
MGSDGKLGSTAVAAFLQRSRGRASLVDLAALGRAARSPPLARVDIDFDSPVDADRVEALLQEELLWLFDLFAGRRLVLCGLWERSAKVGRLRDLGRPLIAVARPVVPQNVIARDYLDQVLPTWQSMSNDERLAIKIGVGILAAMPADLEPAVVVGAMGLEHLAEAFLPAADNSYDVPRTVRRQVFTRLHEAAAELAPDTRWFADLDRLQGNLFHAPASDRITELCRSFRIALSDDEVKAYAAVRNPVTHGRPSTVTAAEKVRAMLFERQALGEALLRRVGYTGPVHDVRAGRLLPRPQR